jgi:hypothetical protein
MKVGAIHSDHIIKHATLASKTMGFNYRLRTANKNYPLSTTLDPHPIPLPPRDTSRERVRLTLRHNHAFAAGTSMLMPRNIGITFSANSFMLFSVYSRGALPTEKFAISRPNPTFLA